MVARPTATDLTHEHYLRPEVREIITRFAMPGDGTWRALNGDFYRWYHYDGEHARLLNAIDDYETIIDTYRTLYQTLNVFDPGLRGIFRLKQEITPGYPLGTPADTQAYTLGCDIDKGHGCNIEDLETKQAVEAAAQFLVANLKKNGIHDSVWVLFSGGGIYVHIHHGICQPGTIEGREEFFEMVTDCFNEYIAHISEEFFSIHPEYKGKVKYDALNNSKRIFKCILSIHKSKPFAVTPLDRDAIKIDFERAHVPLKPDMIEEAQNWYSTYNAAEREPFLKLLDQFRKSEEEKKKRSSNHFKEIWRSSTKADQTDFPPCIKHIIEAANPGEGKTRFSAVLATFLYQMGWDEGEAWELVEAISDRNGLSNANHIFDSCFGRISCPSCATIQNDASGYPHLGLKGLGICKPDKKCDKWPGNYVLVHCLGQMGANGGYDKGSDVEPAIRKVSIDDKVGLVGIGPDGTVRRVSEEENEDGEKKKFLAWVSDCAVHIHTETRAKDDTEFVFAGTGAADGRPVRFTLAASSLAEPKKFKAALLNYFGAKNRIGRLNFEMVQSMSLNIRLMRRVEVPNWDGAIPLLPGMDMAGNVEYRLSPKIPAAVYDGDLRAAKEVLRKILKVHRLAPVVVAAIMGAPAVARWHRGDRFGLGLWGLTGTLKTSMVLAALGIYGIVYLDAPRLKAGKGGATLVAAMEIFASAGFLPQLYDNVKTVDAKDANNYIATMHAILEGEEKARGKKDGGLRDSREFLCTPIITGEVRPQEASTSARVLNLNWSQPDANLLGDVQSNAAHLPVIGYHWLRFLAETDSVLGKDFESFRSEKMKEFLGLKYVNPGRLASIYCLLMASWQLLEESPMGDVFNEAHDSFKRALDDAIESQGQAVNEETEIERFLSGVEELLASNPALIQYKDGIKTLIGSVIGKWMPDGLFLLPTETLNELMKIRAFTQQPSIDSMTQALNEKGLLVPGEGRHLRYRMRFNGGNPRGWYVKSSAFPVNQDLFPQCGNTKTDSNKPDVPTFPQFPQKKKENIFGKNWGHSGESQKDFKENGGNSGNTDGNDRVADSDFDNKVGVPTSVPTEELGGNMLGMDSNLRQDEPTPPKKTSPTTREKVRIINPNGYRTQIPSPDDPKKFIDRLYSFGEVVELEHWNTDDLIKRGIAEAVPV